MRASLTTVACLLLAFPAAAAPDIHVYATPGNSAMTEGETVVDGDPAAIYAVVLDYARWTEVFPDVTKVVITQHQGADARVTLVRPDGNKDNLKFHATPQARMLYFEDTGNAHAEVWGEIVCAPGDQPGTTRVHTRLYADVKGIASVIVSGDSVRAQREQKIERDLVSIRSYFRRTSRR